MDNEGQNEKPQVEGGISLFKILVIILLLMIIGLLVYMYKIEYSNYDDIEIDPTDMEEIYDDDFYYKGVPDVVEDEAYYEKPDYKSAYNGTYSSQPKTFEYKAQTLEIDEQMKIEAEEQKKKIEEFNTTQKSNIVLSNIYSDSENRLAYTYELTNYNLVPEDNISVQVIFYDETGKAIATEELYYEYIPAKSSAYNRGTLHDIKYSKYDYLIEKSYDRGVEACPKESIEYEIGENPEEPDTYLVNIKNISRDDINAFFKATYKDETGKIICVENCGIYLDGNPNVLMGKIQDLFKNEDDLPDFIYYESTANFSKTLVGPDDYREDPVPYKTCEIEYVSAYRYDDYSTSGEDLGY